MRVWKSFHFLSAVMFGICCLFWAGPGEAEHRPKVLFLNSYHPGFAWSDSIVEGVKEVFADTDLDVNLSIEYLDTKRQALEVLSPHLNALYRHKYEDEHFDVILSSDNNAFDFALMLRQ